MKDLHEQELIKQLILQQAEDGKISTRSQIEELKQAMSYLGAIRLNEPNLNNSLNSELAAYAVDKSLSKILSVGMGTEISQQRVRAEVVENASKISEQVAIQEKRQEIQTELIRQKDRGLDIGLCL